MCSENCQIKVPKEADDPETRKFAVKGLDLIVKTIGLQDECITSDIIEKQVFELCLSAMNDYTMDKRGDIGSIVREAAMASMASILRLYCQQRSQGIKVTLSGDLLLRVVQVLLQ